MCNKRAEIFEHVRMLYTRQNRISDIAKNTGLSNKKVGMITQELGFHHGIEETPYNMRDGKLRSGIVHFGNDKFKFLDNVDLQI